MTTEQIAKGHDVANILGLTCIESDNWAQRFALPNDGTLSFSEKRNGGQAHLHISAHLNHALSKHAPYYRDGEAPKADINVSTSRTAEQIANEIRRRLLPEYQRALADALEGKRKHDDWVAQRLFALTKVGAVLHAEIHYRDDMAQSATAERETVSLGKFSFEATPGYGCVTITVDCEAQLGEALAEFLAKL